MHADFRVVENVNDFAAIPEGVYLCRIAEVRPGKTREGGERWGLRLEVAAGEYVGRTAAWDGVSWSERGLKRAKFVLEQLGFDCSGELEIQPSDLEGCRAVVQLQIEDREDPVTGVRLVRLKVPFLGWEPEESWSGRPEDVAQDAGQVTSSDQAY